MGNRIFGAAGLGCAVAVMLGAVPASAQTFIDVFAGRAFPDRTPITLTAAEARINGTIVPAELRVDVAGVEPSNSTIYGARIGHWFGRNFGFALDISTLDPDVKRQTVRATANLRFDEQLFGEEVVIDPGQSISVDIPRIGVPTTATVAALAMLRVPVGATPTRPVGTLSPYAFVGPVWLITDPSLDGNLGVRAGGGVRVPITGGLGLFAEYRFTHVNADATAGRIGGSARGVDGSTGDIRVDLRLRNHSGVGGISLQF